MTRLQSGSATNTGLVRHNNQDNFLVTDALVAVADGMGGHAGGEVASQLAVTGLREAFAARPGPHSADDLIASIDHANEMVFAQAQADTSLRGMGTTLTAAALVLTDGEERIAIANVGDSRTYVFSRGELTQLTEDHSVAEELVRQGQISPEEVDTHPQRHILTRAMGIYPSVEADLWEVLPFGGDRLVLCSDGLVREVTDDQIAAVLRRLGDPGEAASDLVARALAAGGSDNVTVVVVNVVDDDAPPVAGTAGASGAQAQAPSPARGPGGDGEPGPALATAAEEDLVTPVGPLPRRPPRLTLRLIGFVVLIALVFGGGAVAVAAYARDSYFVALGPSGAPGQPAARPLLIYRGRPGGLLWFHPSLVQRTQVLSTQVLPARLPDLRTGHTVASLTAARAYVANLVQEAAAAAGSGPAPTSGPPAVSPTTTRP